MTLQEFKAWFEGFTENIKDDCVTPKQWARIKARVKDIDGTVTTERVFIDRYWGPHYGYPYSFSIPAPTTWISNPLQQNAPNKVVCSNATAMYTLGQADNLLSSQ